MILLLGIGSFSLPLFFSNSPTASPKYHQILSVPPKARNVRVKKVASQDGNYLAAKSVDGTFVLNGDW
jgi:hypothetical protein